MDGDIRERIAFTNYGFNINEWNSLNITIIDNQITVSSNDTNIISIFDNSISHGAIGLYSSSNSDAQFKNLSVEVYVLEPACNQHK